jgi:hypothetical protein
VTEAGFRKASPRDTSLVRALDPRPATEPSLEDPPATRRLQRAGKATGEAGDVGPLFAHPSERALARVFDDFGIAWLYEPHTFLLELEGRKVLEACTPDFYLPELDMYIECTTMRQELTTRKNRKYRKLREQFGIVVEIMYRRDFVRLGLLGAAPNLERAG